MRVCLSGGCVCGTSYLPPLIVSPGLFFCEAWTSGSGVVFAFLLVVWCWGLGLAGWLVQCSIRALQLVLIAGSAVTVGLSACACVSIGWLELG